MGEYFVWINQDKRQYLDQHACNDYGWMFGIASMQRCDLTEAACTLIAGYWRGDRVIFAGDYLSFGDGEYKNHNERLSKAFGEYPYENCYDGEYEELAAPDPIVRYRFAINETKREYVDRDDTPLADVCELPSGELVWSRYDPVPPLFSPLWSDDDPIRGRWCLDDIRFSHEPPSEGYKSISHCWVRWGETVALNDDEIRAIVYSDDFQRAIVEQEMRRDGNDIELHGAVEAIARIIKE